jgi:hypothetical protein
MSARGTALLVGVLAVLGSWLWLLEWGTPPAPVSTVAPLLVEPPARVARVELQQGTRRLVALRRESGWTDAHGRPWQGDVVPDVLATLATLAPVMVVDDAPHAADDYGLAPPARRLRLATAAEAPVLDLEIGEPNPAATGLYARVGGRREVVLVGALLGWELEKLASAAPDP